MQTNKIKKLSITGFRGVKDKLEIDFKKSQSLLLYGDNGTGKSTITDSIEWFLHDKIPHLTGEGILKNEGLRYKDLSDKDESSVGIEFSNSSLNSTKILAVKNQKLTSKYSNKKDNFKNYLDNIKLENLLIRNDELIKFIISEKSKRLSDISDLIGYSEVKKTKDELKKSVSELTKLIKGKDFENRISYKQNNLLQSIGCNINSEEQFFSTINSLCKDLKLGFEIKDWKSFKEVEKKLLKIKPDPKLNLKSNIENKLLKFPEKTNTLNQLNKKLKQFQSSFKNLSMDKEKLKGIKVKSLLREAKILIEAKVLDDLDKCPLCLQNISYEDLLQLISERLEKLQSLEKETEKLNNTKNDIVNIIQNLGEFLRSINELLKDAVNIDDINKFSVNNLKTTLDKYLKDFRNTYQIFSNNLNFSNADFYDECINKITAFSIDEINKLLKILIEPIKESDNNIIKLASKIKLAKEVFKEIQILKKEKIQLEHQANTMGEIYKSFAKYQKEAMELFLSSISSEMNDFFKFMYPRDNIKNIKLDIISNDEDIIGISYNLNFRDTQINTPNKFLSESYLNCLGLCLFLSSVKIFNKKNKFFVLDDVISSFDKKHRLLFGRLLIKKFSDWQIIVLTHEYEWFKILTNEIQSKNWIVEQIKWNNETGSYLDEKLITLEEIIKDKIAKSDVDGLGNLIRKYLEKTLKTICENLEVSMKFQRGEKNEKRSVEELIGSLLKRAKEKQMGSKIYTAINNLKTIQFIGNETSHDNNFSENLADLQPGFQGIQNFKKIFICAKTHEPLLAKNASNGKISTKSGYLSHPWK